MLGEKREFPQIADSAYLVYGCSKLGWRSREDYLMESKPEESYVSNPSEHFDCPYWEAPES